MLLRSPSLVALLAAVPAFAQSALTGVVRDSSGAAMPGVMIEAASST